METPHAAGRSSDKYPDQLEGEVAGCRVHLQLDTRTVPWHTELSGALLLEGGEEPAMLSMEVRIEAYPDQVAQGQELLPFREWNNVCVKPRERVRICFALRMPGSVPIRRMRLYGEARTDWRHAVKLTAQIHVAPPVPFQQMAALLEELTGIAVGSWNTFELGDGVVARFLPSKEGPNKGGPKPFDALQLELFRNNGMVYGKLVLDPLNRTFADRLRTAAGADRVSFPFRFPEGDLSGVPAFYEQSLRPYQDGLRGLPIPVAQPGPAAEELPLPSRKPTDPGNASEQ